MLEPKYQLDIDKKLSPINQLIKHTFTPQPSITRHPG
jgi:hypothetical protein